MCSLRHRLGLEVLLKSERHEVGQVAAVIARSFPHSVLKTNRHSYGESFFSHIHIVALGACVSLPRAHIRFRIPLRPLPSDRDGTPFIPTDLSPVHVRCNDAPMTTPPGGRWVRVPLHGGGERADWVPDDQPPAPDGGHGRWHAVLTGPGQWRWEWVDRNAAATLPPSAPSGPSSPFPNWLLGVVGALGALIALAAVVSSQNDADPLRDADGVVIAAQPAPATTTREDHENAYVGFLYGPDLASEGYPFREASRSTLLVGGEQTCGALDRGVSYAEVSRAGAQEMPNGGVVLVAAAATYLCPEHHDKLSAAVLGR